MTALVVSPDIDVWIDDLRVNGPQGPIVTDMRLRVEGGQTVAIVGESGSGKSMTAKAITGLLPRGVSAAGTLHIGGRTIDLAGGPAAFAGVRGTEIALLLQNPFTSLSPVHRCGRQIAAALPGDRRGAAADAEVIRRLDEVDLPARVARQYPFELSGGMRQRVALAASLASDPQVLIGDEPTTALDVTTQAEVLDLIARIQAERSMGVLLITHDLGIARQRADRILVMYAGQLIETGPGDQVFDTPRHPYSAGLRDSEPPLDRRLDHLPSIPGSVAKAWDVPTGCVFAPRCPLADDHCRSERPRLEDIGPARQVACWKPLDDHHRTIPVVSDAGLAAAASDEPPLLTVDRLSKRFADHAPPALDDVSIAVHAGESVGIVGESGSGKTTLARCLVGLETADSGQITWHVPGRPAQRAQVVFQDPSSALNPAMTVGAALGEALRAGGRDPGQAAELLELVRLPADYIRRRPGALSGGEQQRVALARAIAPRPALLICDEPVSSLDVSVQAQMLNLLNDLVASLGLTLLFITHDLAVVRQVAQRVYVMRHGRIVESGAMEDVAANPHDDYTRQLFASVPGALT